MRIYESSLTDILHSISHCLFIIIQMLDFYSKKTGIQFRYLTEKDYGSQLFSLFSQLTKAPLPDFKSFSTHLQKMASSHQKHIHIIGVQPSGKIVAHGSIIICNTLKGKVGKIQNIVTCESVRGKGYGKVIIQILKAQAWINDCTFAALICQNKNVQFYKKLGFTLDGLAYACYKQK